MPRPERPLARRLALTGSLLLPLLGCQSEPPPELRLLDGTPDTGARLIALYGCGSCHAIPGVVGASGAVGPPLHQFGRRTYISGSIPNQPEALVRWLQDPPAMAPDTAMPNLGLSEQEARDMAAYLYTLR